MGSARTGARLRAKWKETAGEAERSERMMGHLSRQGRGSRGIDPCFSLLSGMHSPDDCAGLIYFMTCA